MITKGKGSEFSNLIQRVQRDQRKNKFIKALDRFFHPHKIIQDLADHINLQKWKKSGKVKLSNLLPPLPPWVVQGLPRPPRPQRPQRPGKRPNLRPREGSRLKKDML